MKLRMLSIFAAAAIVSACGGDDAAEGEGEVISQDTSAIQGMDTISQPTVVPTTDTVVTTTTVDTMQGQATEGDTVVGDTAAKM
jgi:hypothetical protein